MAELARTVPVETFEDLPFVGLFTLRTDGKTIAIGEMIKVAAKEGILSS